MKVTAESLRICEKCGNVMVNRVLRRNYDANPSKMEKILQCIVCRHWISLE
ncbi:MAG: hypothetical protein ACTSPU_05050 [Promethearchaeota archaeon]